MKLTKNELGSAIKTARENLGISQETLAEKVGVSSAHIKHIEGGNRKPSVDVLFRIMKELQMSVDNLVFDKKVHTSQTYLKAHQMLQESTDKEQKFIISALSALREK